MSNPATPGTTLDAEHDMERRWSGQTWTPPGGRGAVLDDGGPRSALKKAGGGTGFGTLPAPQSVAGREGKECPGFQPSSDRRSGTPQADRLAFPRQGIVFPLACIGNPRCTRACQSPQPRPPSSPRAGFLHTISLSSLWGAGQRRPADSGHDVSCPYSPSSLQPLQSVLVARAFQPVGRGAKTPRLPGLCCRGEAVICGVRAGGGIRGRRVS